MSKKGGTIEQMANNITPQSGSKKRQSQYHHFIPRFVLRKFMATDQPPAGPSFRRTSGSKRKSGSRDFMVNTIDLESVKITQRPVSQQFGLVDMYCDRRMENQHQLEEKLSTLESGASQIMAKAFERFQTDSLLELTRTERNDLRKFLFLMKYRNLTFFDRYNHQDVKDYDADDRERMVAYMQERNLTSPKDVWFANLQGFLNISMDAGGKWMADIKDIVYPDDALMFIMHMQSSFMSFCRTDSEEQEFILTENGYGIFEGPSCPIVNPETGKIGPSLYTEYHNFAPMSPNLIIILRSFLLPSQGDTDDFEEDRKNMYESIRKRFPNPESATSLFQNLPVARCQNSYSKIVNGRAVLKSGKEPESHQYSSQDIFYFQCFNLSRAYVRLINSILLEEAYGNLSIVFRSRTALRDTIEGYIGDDTTKGLKIVTNDRLDKRLPYLKKLERIVQQLGGNMRSKYQAIMLPKPEVHMSHYVGVVVGLEILKKGDVPKDDVPDIYNILKPGGTRYTFIYDLDQACRMMFMHIKIDTIIRNCKLDKAAGNEIKLHRRDLFVQLPIERVWLYIKVRRNLRNFDTEDFKKQIAELELDGVEDEIARGVSRFPLEKARLTHAMFMSTIV